MSNTDTQKTSDTSSAANGRVGSSDSSASGESPQFDEGGDPGVHDREEESAQCEADEDAFNEWNRDIDGYEPTLWDAYLFGLKRRNAQLEKNCTQIYDAGRATEDQLGKRIAELEEHALSVRHSRDFWADRAALAEANLRKALSELTFWLEHARQADMHHSARGTLAAIKQIRATLPPLPNTPVTHDGAKPRSCV